MLRRRALLIVLITLCAVGVALGMSLRSTPVYKAEASVLLSQQNLAGELGGGGASVVQGDPDRVAQNQVELARSAQLARQVLASLNRTDVTAADFLRDSTVQQYGVTDVLRFAVERSDPDEAREFVNAYGREFVEFRQKIDTTSIKRARDDLEARLRELREGTQLYDRLLEKRQELDTLVALQTSNAILIRPAEPDATVKVSPKPVRAGILGLMLGLILALTLSLGRDALDTRLRTQEDLLRLLGLPMLGWLPETKRRRAAESLVMRDRPGSEASEPFRLLRTNIDLLMLDEPIRTLLVTSAVEREGKSTTAANLAIAWARPGRDVVLVDLDLRRPSLATMFGITPQLGLTDVAAGHCELADALVEIPLEGESSGRLRVLAPGSSLTTVGEFVAGRRLRTILAGLSSVAELVVIDSPPALSVGDALTISASVDALVVVARPRLLRRRTVGDLRAALDTTPARKLGAVLVGQLEDTNTRVGYGYGYGYGGHPPGGAEQGNGASEVSRRVWDPGRK